MAMTLRTRGLWRAARGQQRRGAAEVEKHPTQRGLEEFVGDHILQNGFLRQPPDPGAAWTKAQLEAKSYGDLRRVWFQLLKERNQLKSVEMFYRQQEETFGEFPHASRFDRVETSMRRLKEVLEERHRVATRVAWNEFVKRVAQRRYNFPPGPPAPAGYDNPRRKIRLFSRARLTETPTDYIESEDDAFVRIKERLDLVFDLDIADAVEALTEEGQRRAERLDFVTKKLRETSRNLLGAKRDLVRGWRAEKKELEEKGPYEYVVTLRSAADAEKVLQRAAERSDEVMLLTEGERGAVPLRADFADDEHLVVAPGMLPLEEAADPMYAHIMAREEHLIRADTRPAPVVPMPFAEKPFGVDPITRRRRTEDSAFQQNAFEYSGLMQTAWVDAPHEGTRVINRFNIPGEPVE